MITVPMTVSVSQVALQMGVTLGNIQIPMSVSAKYEIVEEEVYEGPYTFTPSSEEQVISTNGKVMEDDITINPIPSNYGLITWNGSYLTVS